MEENVLILAGEIINGASTGVVSVCVGVSCVFHEMGNISIAYQEAVDALKFKFNIGKGQIIFFRDISYSPGNVTVSPDEIQKNLVVILNSGDRMKAESYMDSLFAVLENYSSENTVRNLCFSIVLSLQLVLNELNASFHTIFGKESLLWEKLIRFETILDIKQWLKNIICSIVDYLNNANSSQFRRIVEETRKQVEKNYNTGISVKSIADALFYNPNYLNNIFKQETGMTILEYITKVRVEAAKEILSSNPSIRMYELSEKVGYSHESYFKNVFRQYTGLTPKEYKERMK